MENKTIKRNASTRFFFCPASDYLNQHNETGSHGVLSYQFLRHLSTKPSVKNIFAVVMMSMPVTPIPKTKIKPLIHKPRNASLNDFDSLFFYLLSYLHFFRSKQYREADVVHQIIPFKFGRSFNLFFIRKDRKKKYAIGPIVSHHINDQISSDEKYVYQENITIRTKLSGIIFNIIKSLSLKIFGSVLSKLSLLTFQKADILFFSDNYSLSQHKQYLKKDQKVVILDTGIDVSVFKPLDKRTEKKTTNTIKILFVGRLTKRKGCEYLIKAVHMAREKKKDIKIHCTILGYGPLKEDLEDLVKELELTDYITFLPGVKNEELITYYHEHDIICIPALSDTFTVIKEGMASGTPVIVTDVCSHKERVKHGIDSFIVPPADPKAIADVFVEIAENPSILNKLSQNAQKVRSLYDWNNILDRYIEAIQQVV